MRCLRNAQASRQVVMVLCSVLLVLLAACGQAATNRNPTVQVAPITPTPTLSTMLPASRYQVTVQRDLAYGPLAAAGETLDLCLPVGASSAQPGVILIHGGGWVNGDKSLAASDCQMLASYGFVAAAINYRLAPAYRWPAQLVDTQLAVRWLRQNAARYGLDKTRLCSLGDSSGGHLAVFLGVDDTIYPGDQAGLLSDQSPAVTCVVDEFGPVDLPALNSLPDWQGLFSALFGPALKTNPNLLHDASPLFDVSPKTPPTLIIQGAEDMTVPESQSQELEQALLDVPVPVEYLPYQGGHEFQPLVSPPLETLQAERLDFLAMEEHL